MCSTASCWLREYDDSFIPIPTEDITNDAYWGTWFDFSCARIECVSTENDVCVETECAEYYDPEE